MLWLRARQLLPGKHSLHSELKGGLYELVCGVRSASELETVAELLGPHLLMLQNGLNDRPERIASAFHIVCACARQRGGDFAAAAARFVEERFGGKVVLGNLTLHQLDERTIEMLMAVVGAVTTHLVLENTVCPGERLVRTLLTVPHLRILELSYCGSLDNEAALMAVRQLPALESFTASFCGRLVGPYVLLGLGSVPRVTIVDLSYCR